MLKSWVASSIRPQDSTNFLLAANMNLSGAPASGLQESKQVMTGLGGLFQVTSFLRTAAGTLGHWVEVGAPGYFWDLCPLLATLAQGLPVPFPPCVIAVVEWPGLRVNSGW